MFYRELRPMSAGDILDNTLAIYKNKFSTIIPISLFGTLINFGVTVVFIVSLFIIMLILGLTSPNFAPENSIVFVLIAAPIILIFTTVYFYILYLQQGATVKLVSELFLQQPANWFITAKLAIKKMGAFFGALTLVSLIVLLPCIPAGGITGGVLATGTQIKSVWPLLLVVWLIAGGAASFLFFKYMFVPQVVMLENKTGFMALQKSASLFSKRAWPIIGVTTALYLFITTMSGILVVVGFIPFVGGFIQMAASIFLQPLFFIGTTLIYYDVRIRTEGFDLLVLAEELADGTSNQS